MTKIVNFSKLSFSYGNAPILSDIDLSIYSDEIVTVLGRSGSGKSTLLNLISGFLSPSSGELAVNTEIVYLFQDITLLPFMTALENSLLSCMLRGTKSSETSLIAEELLLKFGFTDKDNMKFPSQLSGGMKQRIGIVQALLVRAPLYLFDEPFNAIDTSLQTIIEDYVWSYLKTYYSSAIFITHNIDQAIRISDRLLIINSDGVMEVAIPESFKIKPPHLRVLESEFKTILYEIYKHLGV